MPAAAGRQSTSVVWAAPAEQTCIPSQAAARAVPEAGGGGLSKIYLSFTPRETALNTGPVTCPADLRVKEEVP